MRSATVVVLYAFVAQTLAQKVHYLKDVTSEPDLPKAPLPVAAMSKSFGSLFKTFERNGIMEIKMPSDTVSQEAQLDAARSHLIISRAKRMEKDLQMKGARLAFRKKDVEENGGETIEASRVDQRI